MGKLSAVSSVVHKEELDVLFVTDEHLLESVGEEEAGSLVRGLADAGHHLVASVLSSDSAINTVGLSPRSLDKSLTRERFLLRLSCTCQTGNG